MALYYSPSKSSIFFDEFNRIFENSINNLISKNNNLINSDVDIIEYNDHFKILADLPGFEEHEIKIENTNKYLTIQAEKTKNVEDSSTRYFRKERKKSKFYKSFVIPENIDVDKINASFKNGELVIEVPKNLNNQENKKRIIKLNVN